MSSPDIDVFAADFDTGPDWDSALVYDSEAEIAVTFAFAFSLGVTATVLATPYSGTVATQMVADQQWWLVPRERRRAADALWRVGEAAIFVVMWSRGDYDAGYVGLCPNCQGPPDVQSVYQQSAYHDCAQCSGTGYSGAHGGAKALLVRPSVWTWDEEQTQWLAKGEVDIQSATVTTTGDVWANRRDYVVRGDGNRYIVTGVTATHLATGYGTPSHVADQVTVSLTVALEPSSLPVYALDPTPTGVVGSLGGSYGRGQADYSTLEFVDGPLEQR